MDTITPIYNATSTAVTAAYYAGKTVFYIMPGIISSLTGINTTTILNGEIPYSNLIFALIVVFIFYVIAKKLLQLLWSVVKNFVALCTTFIIVFVACHACGYCWNIVDYVTSSFYY